MKLLNWILRRYKKKTYRTCQSIDIRASQVVYLACETLHAVNITKEQKDLTCAAIESMLDELIKDRTAQVRIKRILIISLCGYYHALNKTLLSGHMEII